MFLGISGTLPLSSANPGKIVASPAVASYLVGILLSQQYHRTIAVL
jgi:hypothetical protein